MALQKISFRVEGMSCTACSSAVDDCLNHIKGVKKATVNFADSIAFVEYNPEMTDVPELQKAIRQIGYDLVDTTGRDIAEFEQAEMARIKKMKIQTYLALGFAIPVFFISMFFHSMPLSRLIMMSLSIPVFWVGRIFFINAWKRALKFSSNMDTLVALSTGVAFVFSLINTFFPDIFTANHIEAHVYYESACVIIALVMLGKYFEAKARFSTSQSIRKLMKLAPKKANLIKDNEIREIPVEEVIPGDVLLVKSGDYIPLDGMIVEGSGYVDESMISGESLPVEKLTGQGVIGATLNISGSFQMKVTRVGRDTVLARIIKTIQEAQASKAPVQQTADKIAKVFVPIVILIALVSSLFWLFMGEGISFALTTGITVLIISCPCALGLATPTALIAGIGKAAEQGILIKDALALELISKTNILIMDKTGTLTMGKPSVTSVIFHSEKDHKKLGYLSGAESYSEHPLSGAIIEYFEVQGIFPIFPETFTNIPGKGILATFGNLRVLAGNMALLAENGIKVIPHDSDLEFADSGAIYAAIDNQHFCTFLVSDKIKPGAFEIIKKLKSQNIEIHLLSGDHNSVVTNVARNLGIKYYQGETSPLEKKEYVRKLKKAGNIVAMAGDGINDAPALAFADIGIAMGNGTDIAMDTAGLTLIKGDLGKIQSAITISGKTLKTIHQNLFWAFFYNVIAIPVAAGVLYPVAGVLLNPMVAALAMAFSSVSVVTNSLRLKFIK